MNEKATWQRPKTIRRYLHPAASERLFTLWAEGKLVFGEVNVNDFKFGAGYQEGRQYYFDLESCFVWLLYGGRKAQLDFKNVENLITENGVPHHGLCYELDNQKITMEAFCNSARKATCFGRIALENTTDKSVEDNVFLLLRSGKEADLLYGAPNGYVRHEPNPEVQKGLPATWKKSAGCYTDGLRVLRVKGDVVPGFDEKDGTLAFHYRLEGREKKEIYFSLDMGETEDFDYVEEKERSEEYWLKELASITRLPGKLAENPETLKMLRHMTAVLLQTFAYPIGKDYMISRQGGMMSICWPSEAISTIEALTKLGDFGRYLEPVFANHFLRMQQENGEIKNVGAHWGSVTASVIFAFCKYANTAGAEFYQKYRAHVFRAYEWIVRTRRSVVDTENIAGGLFPPQNSNDWEASIQGWTLTDVFNLFAMEELARTAALFGDERAEEVEAEHTAYLGDMKRHYQKFLEEYEGRDELKIPLLPIGDDRHLVDGGFPLIYYGRFILCGVIEKEKDIRRVYNYMRNHGICQHDLYGYMPYPDGNRHTWYMSFPDYYWHIIWTKLGEKEKARAILDNQFRFAMTDEYYMLERYEDNSPYYVPWSPNASATGRTILMMYGEINGYDD